MGSYDMRTLLSTTAVAAAVITLGLASGVGSSAHAAELWNISNPNGNANFKCRNDGHGSPQEVHWNDGEAGGHMMAPQNNSSNDAINVTDANAAQKLQARMRQNDHNYDHTGVESRSRNSCNNTRIDFDVTDYTVIDGSFGFAGCTVTLYRSGAERHRIDYRDNGGGTFIKAGADNGAGEGQSSTHTYAIPPGGGFLLKLMMNISCA